VLQVQLAFKALTVLRVQLVFEAERVLLVHKDQLDLLEVLAA
jgi:hypothetical protein